MTFVYFLLLWGKLLTLIKGHSVHFCFYFHTQEVDNKNHFIKAKKITTLTQTVFLPKFSRVLEKSTFVYFSL